MYEKHPVSTKLALYSHDFERVLIMRYPKAGTSGLPGGHIEKSELPEDALRRELIEELNLHIGNVKRADFFLREGEYGTIILAYTAIAPADVSIHSDSPENETSEWVSKTDIENITNMSTEYKRFILENWPNKKA